MGRHLMRDRCVMPGWSEEFTENLVDDSVPEHRDAPSSFREFLRATGKSGIG